MNSMNNESNAKKVVTGKIMLNRSNLFIPKRFNENTSPKYSTIVIISKEDTETVKSIKEAINAAIEIGRKRFGENIDHSAFKFPLKNGEDFSDDIIYYNSYCMNATSSYKPGVVNHKNEKISIAEVVDGQYGRVSVTFHPYNVNNSLGISCRLHNVQLYKDRFDPSKYLSDPQDDFCE